MILYVLEVFYSYGESELYGPFNTKESANEKGEKLRFAPNSMVIGWKSRPLNKV